jgi:hypothetical protein
LPGDTLIPNNLTMPLISMQMAVGAEETWWGEPIARASAW